MGDDQAGPVLTPATAQDLATAAMHFMKMVQEVAPDMFKAQAIVQPAVYVDPSELARCFGLACALIGESLLGGDADEFRAIIDATNPGWTVPPDDILHIFTTALEIRRRVEA
jgi:hypothetical protein